LVKGEWNNGRERAQRVGLQRIRKNKIKIKKNQNIMREERETIKKWVWVIVTWFLTQMVAVMARFDLRDGDGFGWAGHRASVEWK